MRRVYLVWGVLALAAFAASGQLMLRHVPPLAHLSNDVRLMYRSRHIYLLGSGIANVLLGLYLASFTALWRRSLQFAGSILFLAAPVFLALAFLTERADELEHTRHSHLGVFALLGGTILHFVAAVRPEGRDG